MSYKINELLFKYHELPLAKVSTEEKIKETQRNHLISYTIVRFFYYRCRCKPSSDTNKKIILLLQRLEMERKAYFWQMWISYLISRLFQRIILGFFQGFSMLSVLSFKQSWWCFTCFLFKQRFVSAFNQSESELHIEYFSMYQSERFS